MRKKYRILVYRCRICNSLVGVWCDERKDPLDTFDLEEHCLTCNASIDDFVEEEVVEVEAETLAKAIDKAVEIVKLKDRLEEVEADLRRFREGCFG